MRLTKGFTAVEILIVVVVVSIIAAIGYSSYVGAQRRSEDALVRQTIVDAKKSLETFHVFNKYYPSNLANTEYAPPLSTAVAFFTDAPQIPVYGSLDVDQNAQLFINTCNAYMPITADGNTYNNLCRYDGNNLHIKGTVSSNVVFHGPVVTKSDIILSCGDACNIARNNILQTFEDQGGTFPIKVPKKEKQLPAPNLVTMGVANRYCLEGRSAKYTDIIYHATDAGTGAEPGACADDPELHYP